MGSPLSALRDTGLPHKLGGFLASITSGRKKIKKERVMLASLEKSATKPWPSRPDRQAAWAEAGAGLGMEALEGSKRWEGRGRNVLQMWGGERGRRLRLCLPDSRGSAPSRTQSPHPGAQELGGAAGGPQKKAWDAKCLGVMGPPSGDHGLVATGLRSLENTRSLSFLCKGLWMRSRTHTAQTPSAQPSRSKHGPNARRHQVWGRGAASPHPPFHRRAEKDPRGGWGEVVAAPLTPSCAVSVQVMRSRMVGSEAGASTASSDC